MKFPYIPPLSIDEFLKLDSDNITILENKELNPDVVRLLQTGFYQYMWSYYNLYGQNIENVSIIETFILIQVLCLQPRDLNSSVEKISSNSI